MPFFPIAIPMSAFFKATPSLTPSPINYQGCDKYIIEKLGGETCKIPVIATIFPSFCNAFTMANLCFGVTR